MKIRLLNLLWLKPYDESSDKLLARQVYRSSPSLALALCIAIFLIIATFVMSIIGSRELPIVYFVTVLALIALCVLEWHAGLKAHALNMTLLVFVFGIFLPIVIY